MTNWIPVFNIPSIEDPLFLENNKDIFLYKVNQLLNFKDDIEIIKSFDQNLELREYLSL